MNEKYKNYCPDWDYIKIDENDGELAGCHCFNDEEFKAYRERHCDALDRFNEAQEEIQKRHMTTIKNLADK